VPILGSDVPMIARFIADHGVGLAVDPEDVGAVASGLRRLLDPALSPAYREAASRAAATLDGRAELETLATIYRQALPDRP